MERKNENHEKKERCQILVKEITKSVTKSENACKLRGRYCRKRASEGPHANLEDSGVISAKESTVARGITVSGAGIGES